MESSLSYFIKNIILRIFHAEYRNDEVLIEIQTMAVFAGKIPPRALGLVMEWASLHQEELLELWNDAREMRVLHKIEPLA